MSAGNTGSPNPLLVPGLHALSPEFRSDTARRAWVERRKNIALREELATLRALVTLMQGHLAGSVPREQLEDAIAAYETQLVLQTLGDAL